MSNALSRNPDTLELYLLRHKQPYIYLGYGTPSINCGIRHIRTAPDPDAVLSWNEASQRWDSGIVGSESIVVVQSDTSVNPDADKIVLRDSSGNSSSQDVIAYNNFVNTMPSIARTFWSTPSMNEAVMGFGTTLVQRWFQLLTVDIIPPGPASDDCSLDLSVSIFTDDKTSECRFRISRDLTVASIIQALKTVDNRTSTPLLSSDMFMYQNILVVSPIYYPYTNNPLPVSVIESNVDNIAVPAYGICYQYTSDTVFLAYSFIDVSDIIKVVRYSKTLNTWLTIGSSFTLAGGAPQHVAIVASPTSKLYIAFEDPDYSNNLTVALYNHGTGTWNSVGARGVYGPVSNLSMALSENENYLAVGYINATTGALYVASVTLPGAVWSLLPQVSGATVTTHKLISGTGNVVYEVFNDPSQTLACTVAKNFLPAPGAWVVVGTRGEPSGFNAVNNVDITLGEPTADSGLYVSSVSSAGSALYCRRFSQASGTWKDILGGSLPYVIQEQRISYVAVEDTVQLCIRETSDAFIKLAKYSPELDTWSVLASTFLSPTGLRLAEDNSIYGTCWVVGVDSFPTQHLLLASNTQVYPPGILTNYRMYITVKKNGDNTRQLVPITVEPSPLPGEVIIY